MARCKVDDKLKTSDFRGTTQAERHVGRWEWEEKNCLSQPAEGVVLRTGGDYFCGGKEPDGVPLQAGRWHIADGGG